MIRSGKIPPRTPTSSKRVLSSTSPNSSLHERKNTKTFTSPNRFAVLASIDTNDDTVFDAAPPSYEITVPSSLPSDQAEPAAPPIYIRNINNFSALKDVLIKTVGPKGSTCKSTSSYLIVRPNGRVNFNLLSNYLMEINASFHTFRSHCQRPLRIIIGNLHHSTLSADISSALSEEGHLVRNVHNVKKNNCPLPIFFVDIEPNVNNKYIYITSLLSTKVVIEKLNKKIATMFQFLRL
jgi:hypothetical protein